MIVIMINNDNNDNNDSNDSNNDNICQVAYYGSLSVSKNNNNDYN